MEYTGGGQNPEFKTAYGEIKEQQLPDATEVTVNANSRIICSKGWQDGKDREVWMKGEAFFHVRKTPLKSRFIVHTDHFAIIVTGTQFNAVNRGGRANVMLREGSVNLRTWEGHYNK
jgi:ferric-dicitrate binding protein FerR (iron transport regulator)